MSRNVLSPILVVVVFAGCRNVEHVDAGNTPPPAVLASRVPAAISSDQVPTDPDDPAIWLHPTNPARSLVIGTNKVAAPEGALVVYGLDGRIRQTISGIDRPNNVDVEYRHSLRR